MDIIRIQKILLSKLYLFSSQPSFNWKISKYYNIIWISIEYIWIWSTVNICVFNMIPLIDIVSNKYIKLIALLIINILFEGRLVRLLWRKTVFPFQIPFQINRQNVWLNYFFCHLGFCLWFNIKLKLIYFFGAKFEFERLFFNNNEYLNIKRTSKRKKNWKEVVIIATLKSTSTKVNNFEE